VRYCRRRGQAGMWRCPLCQLADKMSSVRATRRDAVPVLSSVYILTLDMVSSLLVDALSNPTKALLDLYSPENAKEFPTVVKTHFVDVFASDTAFNQV
jgi:hypothetical protein